MKNKRQKVSDSLYSSVHYWLKTNFGKADKCENPNCLKKSNFYTWALKREKEYECKRKNFIKLCRSCHVKYDTTENTIKKLKNNSLARQKYCKRGHKFTKENTYRHTKKKTRNSNRTCKICNRNNGIKWNKNNLQKKREALKIWRKNNLKKVSEYNRKYRIKHKTL